MANSINIDSKRLTDSLQTLGKIGQYKDVATGLTGVRRLALSAEDGEGRRHVVSLMKQAGLTVTIDRIGNVFARREGTNPTLAPMMMGSHIDSVPTAGMFDGCLGVMSALEVIRTLNDNNIETLRPVVMAFFTDEEGCRFGVDMLGSAVATGRIPLEQAYALRDRDGLWFKDELEKIGFQGEAPVLLKPPHAYLEVHIEQGPVLRAKNLDIGVVAGVQAISWQELTIQGKPAHAGTTPMELRADAGVAAARINLRMREMTEDAKYGTQFRATMGAIRPHPGLVNIIPGQVIATVDVRNPEDAFLKKAEADLIAFYDEVARREKVKITWRQTARTDSVRFNDTVQALVSKGATSRNLKSERIISGAGHDAQEMSHICRAGMVFVPGEFDGISHNPREFSTPEQCANGVNVALDVVLALANEA